MRQDPCASRLTKLPVKESERIVAQGNDEIL